MIRNLKREEWDDFMRLMENSYGYGPGWFLQHYGDLYDAGRTPLDCLYVVEKAGKLVSHVGLFPMRTMSDGVELEIPGIGGVATLPEERGQGHMHALLLHVIARMKEQGTPLSALWGVRQRYLAYGYESAGERIITGFSQRSLKKNGIEPDPTLREVSPEEAISSITAWHAKQRFRTLRSEQYIVRLRRPGVRTWIGADGYLLGTNKPDYLHVYEVVSAPGKETSMILAAMRSCSNENAQASCIRQHDAGVAALLGPAEAWTVQPEGMFSVINCHALLKAFQPMLQKKASALGLSDFALSIGIRSGEQVDIAGVTLNSGILSVTRDKIAPHVKIGPAAAARLLLGGPGGGADRIGAFSALLPLPICIPSLDRV